MAKHKRKFEGLWIPAKLWFSKEFTLLEKMLMIEVASLDATDKGCFASNRHFAELFFVSPKYISQIIRDLVQREKLKSTIDKPGGNRRYLKPLSDWSGIGYPTGDGEGIPPQQDTPIPPQRERSNNTKTRITGRETNNKGLDISFADKLALDLKITEQRSFFLEKIDDILKPSRASTTTLAVVAKYLVAECQGGRLDVSIFKDLVEDAQTIKANPAVRRPAALFVSVVKEKTGFKKQNKMLRV